MIRNIAAAVVCAALVVGCSGPSNISGKVTVGGKPVASGSVTIHAADGSTHYGELSETGEFSIPKVPPGLCKVAVNSPDPKVLAASGKLRGMSLGAGDSRPKADAAAAPAIPGADKWFKLPAGMEDPEKSGITFTIKGGSFTMNIEK
jgi:hypothetical protein